MELTASKSTKKELSLLHKGSGITVAFRGEEGHIAHITDAGEVSWRMRNPAKALIIEVELIAEKHKTGVRDEQKAPLLLIAQALIEGTFWFFKGNECTPKEATTDAILTLAEALFDKGYLKASFLEGLLIISTLLHLTAYENLDVSTFIRTGGPQTKR